MGPTSRSKLVRASRLAALTTAVVTALLALGAPPAAAAPQACDLPPIPLALGQVSVSSYDGASLAFDGRYLDYTEIARDQSGHPITTTYQKVYTIDPGTCAAGPVYTVPGAVDANGNPAPLYQVTYDPRYQFSDGDLGAILARTGAGLPIANFGGLEAAVFAIDPVSGQSEVAFSYPCQTSGQSCQAEPSLFTYDFFRDRIWVSVPDAQGNFHPTLIGVPPSRPAKAVVDSTQSCMRSYPVGTGDHANDPATWAVGASDILYIQLENNTDVIKVDTRTCGSAGTGFSHQPFREADQLENDQMACDPITFGQGPGGVSVLWLRDVIDLHVVRPYTIPNAFCPFPTLLHLSQPLTANAGGVASACATLVKYVKGLPPIPGQPLNFSLGGSAAGAAVTDGAGRACVSLQAPLQGGAIPLVASFAGTPALLPARDQGFLNVAGTPPAQHEPPPPPVGTAPRGAPGPVAPVQNIVTSQQVQAQGQMQGQIQGQVQTQLQPGVSMQDQEQVQLTVQRIGGGRRSTTLRAVSRQPAPATVLLIQLTAGLLMGVGLLHRQRLLAILRARPATARHR